MNFNPRILPAFAALVLLAAGCATKSTTAKARPTKTNPSLELRGGRLDDIAVQERRIRELRDEIRVVRAHLDSVPEDSSSIRRLGSLMESEETARRTRDDIKQAAEDELLRTGHPTETEKQRDERMKDRLFLPQPR
jgi:hypothetical protein